MRTSLTIAVAVVLVLLPPTAHALEFSAESFVRDNLQGIQYKSKVHWRNGNVRIDSQAVTPSGTHSYDILDLVKRVGYAIDPGSHRYELLSPAQTAFYLDLYSIVEKPCVSGGDGLEFKCKKVGSESLNGRIADKWIIRTTFQGQTRAYSTIWIDRTLRVRVKSSGGLFSSELTNVKLDSQPSSQFEMPIGYTKSPGPD